MQNGAELLKLHLKQHHMSIEQLKRRTSALKLPDSVYAKYELVVKKCEACVVAKPPPARSKVSGIRATNFGDVVLVDHCNIKIKDRDYIFFCELVGTDAPFE